MSCNEFHTPFFKYYSATVAAQDSTAAFKNMKRENKLYSYKDQLAELELRKEIEKKKKKDQPAKPEVKLSKKQQEMVDEQMKQEQEVRERCQQVRFHHRRL